MLVTDTVSTVRTSSAARMPRSSESGVVWAKPSCPPWAPSVADACAWSAMVLSVNQVEQGEQVDPDQIDQVPVQRGVVDRPEIVGAELLAAGLREHPDPDADADQHVEPVEARHEEVHAEEDVRVARAGDA